jgi:peptidoglycan hydrolase-like protein with peptidoglycan-binding domain
VDGIVGDKTKRAIKAFQLAQKLKQSGTFDAATVARLRDLYEAKGPAKPAAKAAAKPGIGHNGGPVLEVQPPKQSGLLGGLVGGIVVDVLGGKILDAVKREVADDNSPITRDKAPEIAGRIIEHVVPDVVETIVETVKPQVDAVAENAGNKEPWYQSRVMWGSIVSVAALAAGFVGAQVDGATQIEIVDGIVRGIEAVSTVVAVGGSLYAIYGRLRAGLKPLGK